MRAWCLYALPGACAHARTHTPATRMPRALQMRTVQQSYDDEMEQRRAKLLERRRDEEAAEAAEAAAVRQAEDNSRLLDLGDAVVQTAGDEEATVGREVVV